MGWVSEKQIELYVADSESSSLRAVDLNSLDSSRNVVGGDENPRNLHSFGDVDGVGCAAKLQHPLGCHFVPQKNVVLVADTYNHKIKLVDPFRNECFTWLGAGDPSQQNLADGRLRKATFNEP